MLHVLWFGKKETTLQGVGVLLIAQLILMKNKFAD